MDMFLAVLLCLMVVSSGERLRRQSPNYNQLRPYGTSGATRYPSQPDYGQEPANYDFRYDVDAPEYGTKFGHQEQRQGDVARGSYYVLLPDGRMQVVEYTADQDGYHPTISYQGGGGGYSQSGGGGGGYAQGGGGGLGQGRFRGFGQY